MKQLIYLTQWLLGKKWFYSIYVFFFPRVFTMWLIILSILTRKRKKLKQEKTQQGDN